MTRLENGILSKIHPAEVQSDTKSTQRRSDPTQNLHQGGLIRHKIHPAEVRSDTNCTKQRSDPTQNPPSLRIWAFRSTC